MDYEKEIMHIIKNIGNENRLNAIYDLIISIKDIIFFVQYSKFI